MDRGQFLCRRKTADLQAIMWPPPWRGIVPTTVTNAHGVAGPSQSQSGGGRNHFQNRHLFRGAFSVDSCQNTSAAT
jgi:hypothetical protein